MHGIHSIGWSRGLEVEPRALRMLRLTNRTLRPAAQPSGRSQRQPFFALGTLHFALCTWLPRSSRRSSSGGPLLRRTELEAGALLSVPTTCVATCQKFRRPDHEGNPHIGESRMLAPARPRMQAAGLQRLKLQIAAASPDPQTRAFPGTELSRKTWEPKFLAAVSSHNFTSWHLKLRVSNPRATAYVHSNIYIYIYIYIYIHNAGRSGHPTRPRASPGARVRGSPGRSE